MRSAQAPVRAAAELRDAAVRAGEHAGRVRGPHGAERGRALGPHAQRRGVRVARLAVPAPAAGGLQLERRRHHSRPVQRAPEGREQAVCSGSLVTNYNDKLVLSSIPCPVLCAA